VDEKEEQEDQQQQTEHPETCAKEIYVTLTLCRDGEVTVDAKPSPTHMYDVLSMLEIAKMNVLREYFHRVDEIKEKNNTP
jgi:hypothetical protein